MIQKYNREYSKEYTTQCIRQTIRHGVYDTDTRIHPKHNTTSTPLIIDRGPYAQGITVSAQHTPLIATAQCPTVHSPTAATAATGAPRIQPIRHRLCVRPKRLGRSPASSRPVHPPTRPRLPWGAWDCPMGQGVPRRYDCVRGDTRLASRRCPIPAQRIPAHPRQRAPHPSADSTGWDTYPGRCRPPVSVRWRLRLRGPACLLSISSPRASKATDPRACGCVCATHRFPPPSAQFRALRPASLRFVALPAPARSFRGWRPVHRQWCRGRERCRLRLPWPCGVPFYLRGRCSACACACFCGRFCVRCVFRFSSLGHRRVVAVPSRFT